MSKEEDSLEMSEPCPQCGAEVSVLGLSLMAEVVCPACKTSFTARTRLHHFKLLKKIGSGGMGSAYRAIDEQLGREVALKILHKEISGSDEEQKKLAEEARRTATINHPNVVKVFNYGSSNGQFYLAMELVSAGSLDDLMTLQGRVPEMQVLNVAIQIASGLQAALEAGMIHRDIKPGNILFADANTAKLVDFGLALVMDEVAASKGEIWGTPYYVAPEKLDGGDEDFRSDIYSLGGTMFHALAGRPPYEAETASMVALKQLQSQVVSLQSFAPDVSSETNYIVTRMMAKNPDDRYQSYAELIDHLQYARAKLAERLRNPKSARAQPPVLVESSEQRKAVGLIMALALAGLFGLILLGYLNRAKIAETFGLELNMPDAKFERAVADARKHAASGNLGAAIASLSAALEAPDLRQPEKNWALLQLGLFQMLDGRSGDADKSLKQILDGGAFTDAPKQQALANFFPNMANFLSQKRRLFPSTLDSYSQDNFEAFAFFLFGANNWLRANPEEGAEILKRFLGTDPKGEYRWINEYKTLAQAMVEDAPTVQELEKAAKEAQTPEQARAALAKLQEARPKLKTGNLFSNKLDKLRERLEKRAK